MNWEISTLKFLESLRGDMLNNVFEVITFTGEGVLLISVIAIIYWYIDKEVGLKFGFIMLFSALGNGILKNIVKAQRPFELEIVEGLRIHTATGYSFPSGHTQSATTFWVTLMMHVKQRWLYCVGVVMIMLTALSRIYLGVHWPVDVLAAIVVGVAFTIIGQYIFRKLEKIDMWVLLLICVAMGSTLIFNVDRDYIKTIGCMIGLVIGMMLERRYISFRTEGSLGFQISKAIIGFGGLIVVAGGLKLALPELMIFTFFRYMLIVIWIIAGAPYIFKKIVKQKCG
ncbi:MAG TPA: phosphatase PAP2 family protein [Epulopiscium sp.]|nr:phosphatase PAP2 family protein [Candidatus Epulonipiscium sp.]